MYLVLLVLIICEDVATQDVSLVEDIKTLSELPLEKLLNIKKSFGNVDMNDKINNESDLNSTAVPLALPLQSKNGMKEREEYHYEESSSHKDKSSSIQSIFQISITTLAFLAFGGYLICLLVQAVKGKPSNTQATATQIMSALISANVKRRRPTRMPYRLQQAPSNGYRRRKPRPKRDITDDVTESLYHSLISLSEGYTKYHTVHVDYLKYNFSSNYF